eukprot:TRINITY_DN3222_c1_g6_i3.p1 TRINITY_DN3222_c1_g6~~TRINITY_DN3222_c1_g6_i3.p1  ORF type:complete len:227 (+),score=67.61 TRINITY_DN3222_c1_g6_i3:36-683(+)
MSEIYEQILTVVPNAKLYKAGQRSSAQGGYRCSEWTENDFISKANVDVLGVGENVIIKLTDPDTQTLICKCPIRNNLSEVVERAIDSSRYYVVVAEDDETGRKMNVGLGFNTRNESFSFWAAITDYIKRRTEIENAKNEAETSQNVDFSLKTNKKISLNIGSTVSAGSTPKKASGKKLSKLTLRSGNRSMKTRTTIDDKEEPSKNLSNDIDLLNL